MNAVVDAACDETLQRLALGVEPIDAAREQPMLLPVMLTHDDLPLGFRRPPFQRHASNRWALRYDAYYAAPARTVAVRLFDQAQTLYDSESDRRRFVPRRFRIALPTLLDAELAPPGARGCRPHLFPGPAYPVSHGVTGLRAHVMRGPAGPLPLRPARWARVLASVAATQPDLGLSAVVGRAMCDGRGEFLLLVRDDAAEIFAGSELPVLLRVFAAPEAVPPDLSLPALDPLWDLPLESPATLDDTDPVLRGTAMPAGYAEVLTRVVNLPLGRLLRGQPHLVI